MSKPRFWWRHYFRGGAIHEAARIVKASLESHRHPLPLTRLSMPCPRVQGPPSTVCWSMELRRPAALLLQDQDWMGKSGTAFPGCRRCTGYPPEDLCSVAKGLETFARLSRAPLLMDGSSMISQGEGNVHYARPSSLSGIRRGSALCQSCCSSNLGCLRRRFMQGAWRLTASLGA
jgi:hypothetical protein